MAATPLFSLEVLTQSFSCGKALSLSEQLHDIAHECQRHDIMTFAKMVCLKHAGHQDITKLSAAEATLFIEDVDLFLTAVISERLLKQ